MKRFFAIILCTVMLLSAMPLGLLEGAAAAATPNPNDKNNDGYDDSNVYISDIMLAVSSGADNAIDTLKNKGFTVLDNDLYGSLGTRFYMYLGYKTTTDPNKAIRDIKWNNFTEDQYKDGQIPIAVLGGADGSYVATKVHYDLGSNMKLNGQFGFNGDDDAGVELVWFLEEEFGSYTGALIFKTVLDFFIVGLIYEEIMEALMEADYYATMYFGVNESMGDPILASSLMLTENKHEDGYETMSSFAYSDPIDVRWARSQVGIDNDNYNKAYLHFKRAQKLDAVAEEPGDIEYIKELGYCTSDQNLDSLRQQGWTILNSQRVGDMYIMTSFQPRDGYILSYYLMYRTTRDPKEAITDIRITYRGPEITNIASISYFRVFDECESGAIFATRSSSAGTPIPAGSLTVHKGSQPRLSRDRVYARDVFSDTVGVTVSKNYRDNYTLSYEGTYFDQARGKYIAKLLLAKGSKRDALADLSLQGAEAYIDHDMGNGVYMGYITTDDEEQAITDLYIKSLSLVTMNIKRSYNTPNGPRTKDEKANFAMEKPQPRVFYNDAMYVTVGNCMNISNPDYEKAEDYKSHEGETFYAWTIAHHQKNWARDFLYTTTDPIAGDPITRVTFEEKAIANNGSKAVLTDGELKKYGGAYPCVNREDQDVAQYVSAVYLVENDRNNMEKAMAKLINNECTYYVDCDLNYGTESTFCVYLGYAKTTNKRKAVTNIIVLENDFPEVYERDGTKWTVSTHMDTYCETRKCIRVGSQNMLDSVHTQHFAW